MLAVGTSEGHLLIYDVVTKEVNGNIPQAIRKAPIYSILICIIGKKTYVPSLKVSQKSFARKPITQITTVEEHGIIISVAGKHSQIKYLINYYYNFEYIIYNTVLVHTTNFFFFCLRDVINPGYLIKCRQYCASQLVVHVSNDHAAGQNTWLQIL